MRGAYNHTLLFIVGRLADPSSWPLALLVIFGEVHSKRGVCQRLGQRTSIPCTSSTNRSSSFVK
jgi:hypothetical protein